MHKLLGPFLFLLLFGSCAALAIMQTEDAQRCAPVCAPHVYAGKVVNGQCACNMNQILK
jgi:hypothetical protein